MCFPCTNGCIEGRQLKIKSPTIFRRALHLMRSFDKLRMTQGVRTSAGGCLTNRPHLPGPGAEEHAFTGCLSTGSWLQCVNKYIDVAQYFVLIRNENEVVCMRDRYDGCGWNQAAPQGDVPVSFRFCRCIGLFGED